MTNTAAVLRWGAPLIVIGAPLIIIGLVTLAMFVFVLVDMVRRPDWQWRQAGSSKVMWIVLEVALFVLFGFLSIVSGIVYLAAARPKLVAAERSGRADDYGYGYRSQWGSGSYPQHPGGWGGPYGSDYGQGSGAPGPQSGSPNWPGAATQAPPAWQPDPSGRHELRYWDGSRWTEYVSDSGTQSSDPLPEQ